MQGFALLCDDLVGWKEVMHGVLGNARCSLLFGLTYTLMPCFSCERYDSLVCLILGEGVWEMLLCIV